MTAVALSKMRRFVAARETSSCELCALGLGDTHDHLLEPEHRRMRCVCRACHLLFPPSGDARLLRIVPRATRLSDVELDDATWAALGVPVGLAFFFDTRAGDVIATFPGPAGTVESTVSRAAWGLVREMSPPLARLVPDTEALLVSRTSRRRRHFVVSIDRCYELAGLLRSGSGPMSMVDPEVAESFFARLDAGGDAS